jgi:hypothetical protein
MGERERNEGRTPKPGSSAIRKGEPRGGVPEQASWGGFSFSNQLEITGPQHLTALQGGRPPAWPAAWALPLPAVSQNSETHPNMAVFTWESQCV